MPKDIKSYMNQTVRVKFKSLFDTQLAEETIAIAEFPLFDPEVLQLARNYYLPFFLKFINILTDI